VEIAMAAQIADRSDTGNLHLWSHRRNLPSSNRRGMEGDFVCGEEWKSPWSFSWLSLDVGFGKKLAIRLAHNKQFKYACTIIRNHTRYIWLFFMYLPWPS
jgi:hypothetical protein